ncbi:hypothetical protein GCM10010981_09390 [Dyella nitratireducens]|uniref:Uncharacterized protein n=1 Tax=Dyella nitratireducens TaxID=1849580 RepID=A0ABQ1FNB8_9GAMM|nr:hypothetical protein GCM10010981_09390 [Dyella nitratireducens]GLQ43999.1 hypothetical protein GCM10007902_38490 [Dyella nitratireducens]
MNEKVIGIVDPSGSDDGTTNDPDEAAYVMVLGENVHAAKAR